MTAVSRRPFSLDSSSSVTLRPVIGVTASGMSTATTSSASGQRLSCIEQQVDRRDAACGERFPVWLSMHRRQLDG